LSPGFDPRFAAIMISRAIFDHACPRRASTTAFLRLMFFQWE
jgi:hypothetical protein